MIPIAKPLLGEEEKRAVLNVLESGMLAQGQKVAEFEQAFASYIGVKHAIATSSGTSALHTTLLAHEINEGDEIITTPFSFIATANAIKMAGATPVFVDIDEKTFNIDPNLIEAAITENTKAIMPVHLFGRPAEMDKIMTIAQKHNLIVIEDACQAHGASFQDKKIGSFGTGCFSFYPTKNMTTGEGGIITTDDELFAEKARKIINHGSKERYYHDLLGYNYRMTDLTAAIGLEQLKKLPGFTQARRFNASILDQLSSANSEIITPLPHPGHVYHQYTIRTKERAKIISLLNQEGIGNSIFYPLPIPKQESFKDHHQESFPIAEKMVREVLSLPVHPGVTQEDLKKIIEVLSEIDKIDEKFEVSEGPSEVAR